MVWTKFCKGVASALNARREKEEFTKLHEQTSLLLHDDGSLAAAIPQGHAIESSYLLASIVDAMAWMSML